MLGLYNCIFKLLKRLSSKYIVADIIKVSFADIIKGKNNTTKIKHKEINWTKKTIEELYRELTYHEISETLEEEDRVKLVKLCRWDYMSNWIERRFGIKSECEA